jgi:quercetin dioxygenase-like cupin family protein
MHALVIAALIAAAPLSLAIAAAGTPSITPAEKLSWGPAAGLPPGAQVAVLYGDPTAKGPFAIRLKFPAGYEIPTHSHPTDELITVISGGGRMAFGENASAGDAQPLALGAFMDLPAGAWHHLWIDADTVVELHSTGPFEVHQH